MTKENFEENKQYRTLATEFRGFDSDTVRVEVRFTRPSAMMCDRMMKEMTKSSSKAFRNLLFSAVHPDDRGALDSAIEQYPGVLITFGNELLERSGFSAEVVDKLGKL